MNEEMKAFEKNGIWEMFGRQENKKSIEWTYIYIVKHKSDDTLVYYKAILVANGYIQTYDIDYEETFVLVANMNIVWVLLYLIAHIGWELHQFDVTNAFLHENLEEDE